MATDVKTSEKILAYDGDCPMCLATVGTLLRLGMVRPEQTRANYDLAGDDQQLVRAAGIRNQLVVFDAETRETRAGSDGLLWIIGEKPNYRLLALVLGLPGIRQLVRYAYETVSYNRRIISPPRHQIVCDCEPEVTVGRRLTLVVPLLLLAGAIATAWSRSVEGAIALGLPWLGMGLAGVVLLPGMLKVDYLGHLAVTALVGALVLVAACGLMLALPSAAFPMVNATALVAAFGLMFVMQRRRVAALQLRAGWLWAWTVLVGAATALAIVAHFRGAAF